MPRTGMMAIRKDALVNATIACVGKRGALDVTVGQIAKEAGVSSGLAHHYFGSKEQLFLAAMQTILSDFGALARAELKAATTDKERLNAIVTASFGGQNFRPEVIAAWLNFYVMARLHPGARRLLHIYQRRIVANLTHALRPLCDAPEQVACTTAALIDGLYIRHALDEAGPPNPQVAMQTVNTYLEGAIR